MKTAGVVIIVLLFIHELIYVLVLFFQNTKKVDVEVSR